MRIKQIPSAKDLICKKPGVPHGRPMGTVNEEHTHDTPQERDVRQEQHRTRTRNMHLPAYSCAPRNRPRRQDPAPPLACAATSAPSRATRRAADAPAPHMRGGTGRGAAPRGRNTSVRRATRPVAFVRSRLRKSMIFINIGIWA